MTSLNELIDKKIINLSQTEIPNMLEREFLEEFLQQYNVHKYSSFENISNAAYLMAVLTSNNINMKFEELVQHIQVIEEFVNNMEFDIGLFNSYFDILKELNDLGLLEAIINRKKISGLNPKSSELYDEYRKISKELFTIYTGDEKEYDYKINVTFNKLFYFLPNANNFKSFLDLHLIVDQLRSKLEESINCGFVEAINDDNFDGYEKNLFKGRHFSKFIEKMKNDLLNAHIKEFIELNDINLITEYELMRKRYDKILKEDKEVVKNTNKKIKALEELKYKLKYISPERTIKIDKSIEEFLFDPEIKYQYLLFAILHNNNLYKKEENKNKEFNENSFTKMEILFSKYGFNFNDFTDEEKDRIMNEINSFKVEEMLSSIKYSELSFITEYSGEFAKIIIFSKPEVIKFIDKLLKSKLIDKNFIFKNINILCGAREYNNLYNNISYLNSIGVNLSNLVKDNSNLLLLNYNDVANRTSILNEYNFKLDKDDIYNFDILYDDSVLDLFDNYIELGLTNVILDNPKYLTSAGFDTIKRIMICNLIGVNPINRSHKIVGSVNTGDNFYVPPKDYDNFIIDYTLDYENPECLEVLENNKRDTISSSTKSRIIVKKMDKIFMKDELTYIIEGVVISRNRVIRNLEALLKYLPNTDIDIKDLVYQAILYKMIKNIEVDDLNKIYNSICSINLEIDKQYVLK